eukprot:4547034-Pleurochrysis_carterae.AAC.1
MPMYSLGCGQTREKRIARERVALLTKAELSRAEIGGKLKQAARESTWAQGTRNTRWPGEG